MKVVRLQIPSGEPGTDETVRIIRQLIESGKRSLKIRHFAEWIIERYNVSARDRVGEIAAIHDWAKKNIRYVQDPYRVEYVQTPERLLETRTGDCDDFTALVGSLVEAVGYPVDIKVVAKPGRKEFHHVYPVARIGAESVGLDASMPVPLGYESPEISRSKTYRSESNMLDVFGNVAGLGLDIQRPNGITREVTPPVVITGGNGTRKVDPLPPDVIDVTGPVIYPPPPTDDMILPTEGVGPLGPIIYLKLGESYSGYDAKVRMDTGNLRPATPNLMLVFKRTSPGTRNMHGTVTAVVKNGLVPPELPTGGGEVRDGVLYLGLGNWYARSDGQKRMQEGTIRPAHSGLMLVYRPNPTFAANGAGGAVVAVARTVNGNGAGVVDQTVPAAERVTVPEYDIFGEPTTQPIVVTTPGAPVAGIDTKTMLMIGGGLLALILLMRK